MVKNKFLKVWAGVLSSLSLVATEQVANSQVNNFTNTNDNHEILQESSKPDLFLKHAKDAYSDSIMFAGHRSHQSHMSSSSTNPQVVSN